VGGNAVASTAGNSQICGNGIVSAGLWFYCSYSFLENHSLLQHATFFLNAFAHQLTLCWSIGPCLKAYLVWYSLSWKSYHLSNLNFWLPMYINISYNT
jgi:hypothetical protein